MTASESTPTSPVCPSEVGATGAAEHGLTSVAVPGRPSQSTPAVPPRAAGATGEAGCPVPGLPTFTTMPPKWPLTVEASQSPCAFCDGPHTETECRHPVHVHTEGREDCTHRSPQCCSTCHVSDFNARFSGIIWEGTDDPRTDVDCGEPNCRRCRQDDDELAAEKRAELAHEDQGHAGLSVLLPVAELGGGMLALAAASGKLGYLVRHLPMAPTPNGFSLLVLVGLAAGCWLLARRPPATYELGEWDDDGYGPVDAYSDFDPADPYYGTDVDHDPTGWRP